jgi:hypothetical protein
LWKQSQLLRFGKYFLEFSKRGLSNHDAGNWAAYGGGEIRAARKR